MGCVPNYKSFLIINPFGIGDVLFSIPLIRNLKEHFPFCKIFYLCEKRAWPVLKDNPLIDKVFIYKRDELEAVKRVSKFLWFKKNYNFISEIRKEGISVALDLSLSPQFGFFSAVAGIKKRIGYNYKNRGWLLTRKLKFQGYENKHVIEYYLEILTLMGIECKHKKIELFLNKDQKKKAETFLREQGAVEDDLLVAIAPCGGASWGKDSYRKHWPKGRFAKLADMLIDKYKVKIILAGADREKEVIDDIENLMCQKPIKAVNLPLMNFLAVLDKCNMLITNDGGILHMGTGLGLKTVSIFGPVDDIVYGPYPKDSRNHIVIEKDLSCRPCYKKFRLPECPHGLKCLRSITVNEVFTAVKSLLNQEYIQFKQIQ